MPEGVTEIHSGEGDIWSDIHKFRQDRGDGKDIYPEGVDETSVKFQEKLPVA